MTNITMRMGDDTISRLCHFMPLLLFFSIILSLLPCFLLSCVCLYVQQYNPRLIPLPHFFYYSLLVRSFFF